MPHYYTELYKVLDRLTSDISEILKYMEKSIASCHDTEQRFFRYGFIQGLYMQW